MKLTLRAIPTSGIHRGAMIDGSRGFQPTGINAPKLYRRGATVDAVASRGVAHGFMRRAATRSNIGIVVRGLKPIRGLKPTATIAMSLRDEEAVFGRGATTEGSQAFQRPDTCPVQVLRRSATLDVYRFSI